MSKHIVVDDKVYNMIIDLSIERWKNEKKKIPLGDIVAEAVFHFKRCNCRKEQLS